MKCLPVSKLPQANGVALHDWHAEVLAIRAFNRFILDECRHLAEDSSAESDYLRRRTEEELPAASNGSWHRQPFAWREDLTLHMYCSEAPCGDASMELIMSSQEDATPWEPPAPLTPSPPPAQQPSSPPPITSPSPTPTPLLGRGYFSHLGIVRRKPARADAPPSHSKSCSDKLALKQCTSLLSSLTALFVSPRGVYLASLVLPVAQFSREGCRRCFGAGVAEGDEVGLGAGGRMAPVGGRVWEGTGYGFRQVVVETTEREFEFSRRGAGMAGEVKVVSSNLAVAWTAGGEVEEGLIGGVLQGRKGVDVKGASSTSRRKMWAAAVMVAGMLGEEGIVKELGAASYDGVKEGSLLQGRRRVKEEARREALKGWLRNTGDGEFHL
ncbi:adenosine deaminase/editase [Chaetomium tenue]|uniref:Adenosine deaminase/editase n=1 Tax=Chaetomium tenue TaxID=1854479 RepID=A0ACB7P574_9PEZI|nr:adenosine deaminase/editase [Chaetomium globosum]